MHIGVACWKNVLSLYFRVKFKDKFCAQVIQTLTQSFCQYICRNVTRVLGRFENGVLVALGRLENVTHLLEDGQAEEARELLKIRQQDPSLQSKTHFLRENSLMILKFYLRCLG